MFFKPRKPKRRDRGLAPLHAHEVSRNDAALIRLMAGADFGDDAQVTLPSGRTISGAEMRRWIEAQGT